MSEKTQKKETTFRPEDLVDFVRKLELLILIIFVSFWRLFSRLVIVPDLLDPNFVILDTIRLIEWAFARNLFSDLGSITRLLSVYVPVRAHATSLVYSEPLAYPAESLWFVLNRP